MIDVRIKHSCLSSYSLPLCCLDENGNFMPSLLIFQATFSGSEHNILLSCCQCEPVVATMVRAHLWPASPHCPHLAFTFELLDWAEALLLEWQVSLMDFCKAFFSMPLFCIQGTACIVHTYNH